MFADDNGVKRDEIVPPQPIARFVMCRSLFVILFVTHFFFSVAVKPVAPADEPKKSTTLRNEVLFIIIITFFCSFVVRLLNCFDFLSFAERVAESGR
jgi:hypothetical protein